MKIAVWGLAFKPDTDDIREAPALYMIERLLTDGAQVVAFDPEAMPNVEGRLGHRINYASNMYECLEGADALLICTEWSVFRNPDLDKVGDLLNNKVIFDGRNLYEVEQMAELGFTYKSVGRAEANPSVNAPNT